MSARWLYSTTGHRKNASDGVGGLVKHQAFLHNLRSGSTDSFQSALEMVSQVNDKLKNVTSVDVPAVAIEEHRQQKSVEWKSVPCVLGIQLRHLWICACGHSSEYVLSVARTAADQLTEIKPFRVVILINLFE